MARQLDSRNAGLRDARLSLVAIVLTNCGAGF
jgi:hypothetical protein